jgi:hypothetical protein
MHAYAAQDPVFLAMNRRGQRETNNQLGTFCVQCHAPMAVVLGLSDGTNLDATQLPPAANGITCFFCHNVNRVVEEHNNGIELAMDDTMRGGVRDPYAYENPAHNSRYDRKMDGYTNGSAICGSCHDVTTPKGSSLERTYTEWRPTIFTGLHACPGGLADTCSGCHMQSEPNIDVIADDANDPHLHIGVRPSSFHEHMWPGIDQAWTPFPVAAPQNDAQAAAIQRDLRGAVTIVGPTPVGAHYGKGGICVTHDGRITVRIDSIGTGHMWPTGAAQDRRAWLEVTAFDAADNLVFSSGTVADGQDPEALVDPNLLGLWDRTFKDDGTTPAHFFWEVAADPIGVHSQLIRPPTTCDPNAKAFDHSTTWSAEIGLLLASKIDHITARVRIRPYALAMLEDLVSSGDLDPSIPGRLPTFDIVDATKHWKRADVDPLTDGCDSNRFE